jgi:tellurite resistance protein TerC
MMINHFAHTQNSEFYIPTLTSLFIIIALITVSIIASVIRSKKMEKKVIAEPIINTSERKEI